MSDRSERQRCEDDDDIKIANKRLLEIQEHPESVISGKELERELERLSERPEPRELLCQMCGRDYPTWSADNDLWNAVMRGGVRGNADEYDFVCPTCFVLKAAGSRKP